MCSSFTIATSQDLAPYTTYFQFAVIKVADLLWNQSVIIKIMGPWFQKGTKAASNHLYLHTANVRSRNHWKIKKYTHKCSHQLLTDCPSIETPKMLDLCFFIYTLLPRSWNETSTQSLQLVSLLCSWFHHVSHVKTVHYFCLFFKHVH